MYIFLACVCILLFLLLFTYALGGWSSAPWLPIWQKDVQRMLDLADIKPNDKVYDLGAGDGRLLIAAAQNYQATAVGWEISILPYLIGWFKIRILGLNSKVKLKYGNFFKADISQADIICLFLTPDGLNKLQPKLEKEVKSGTKILSYSFKFKDWEPKEISKPDKNKISVYLYQR